MKPPGAKGGQTVVFGQVKEGAEQPDAAAGRLPRRARPRRRRGPAARGGRAQARKLQAYRYKTLRPRGLDDAVTIFTVPTSAGIATLACVDPGADCEAIADTLKLKAGTAFPVGPSKEYAAAARQGARRPGQEGLVRARARSQGAKTPKAQASAAAGLASAYKAASTAVSRPRGLAGRRDHERAARRRRSSRPGRPTAARRGGQVGQQERATRRPRRRCSAASRRSRARWRRWRRRATRSPHDRTGITRYPFGLFPKPEIHATY